MAAVVVVAAAGELQVVLKLLLLTEVVVAAVGRRIPIALEELLWLWALDSLAIQVLRQLLVRGELLMFRVPQAVVPVVMVEMLEQQEQLGLLA